MFEWLEPPPGGPARLRRRFESEHRRRARLRRALPVTLAAASAAAAIAMLLWLRPAGSAPVWAESSPLLLALGVAPAPAETLVVAPEQRSTLALERVPMPPGRVVYYRIGSTLADADSGSATQ